jgi:hypothetical protein
MAQLKEKSQLNEGGNRQLKRNGSLAKEKIQIGVNVKQER